MSFPKITQEPFVDLYKRLQAGELSLEEVREIDDTVLLQLTKTAGDVGQKFFARLGKVKQELVKKRVEELEREGKRVDALKLRMSFLDPETFERALSLLEREVKLEEGNCEAAQKALENLRFFFEKSIVQELDPNSVDSNFATRLEAIKKMSLETGTLEAAKYLNRTQRAGVVA